MHTVLSKCVTFCCRNSPCARCPPYKESPKHNHVYMRIYKLLGTFRQLIISVPSGNAMELALLELLCYYSQHLSAGASSAMELNQSVK